MIRKAFLLVSCYFVTAACFAQSKAEQSVKTAVDQLHTAMINADSSALAKLTSPLLAYVHSGGAVDDKNKFIEKIVSGKSDFVAIQTAEQVIRVRKKIAIVRHVFIADTNDGGKPGEVQLRVMQVWQKQGGQWKLLARQASKLST